MKNCYLIGFIIALVFSLIIFVFHSPLLSFYGVKNGVIGTLDAIAFETAIIKIKYMVLPYFFVSIMALDIIHLIPNKVALQLFLNLISIPKM